ncbi:MAG: molybdopterin-synthase adenylyltransferase MoeB [Nitrospiraceae bacterium]|jgi:adenylyltransferase/sulfurtransferase|nr:molybdopterin-synthase adenylyltransferase MoeB [Nitrospiraceae bacterium]
MEFTAEQSQRYSRHFMLPEIGPSGQEKLARARVFMVGAGGLGSPVGYYLAAAGVGTLGIIDHDVVDLTNLQRQIAHSTPAVGMPKALSAKATFEKLNPDVTVNAVNGQLLPESVEDHIREYDIVVDCSDNFATRFLVNDACVALRKPLVSGAVLKFEGQVTTILPGVGHCYRCLFEDVPPEDLLDSLQRAGILGAVAGVVGTLQAVEVLKYLLGIGELLSGKLLLYDALNARFRAIHVPRNPSCQACGDLDAV